jgi:hypothetical protein
MTAISLMVGSDALGWQELGGKAQLGQMTKAMPGGDRSDGVALTNLLTVLDGLGLIDDQTVA